MLPIQVPRKEESREMEVYVSSQAKEAVAGRLPGKLGPCVTTEDVWIFLRRLQPRIFVL